MTISRNRGFIIAILALFTWSIVATGFAAFYYKQFSDISRILEGVSIKVKILINYGNNTLEWHNETILPAGVTVLNATRAVAKLELDPRFASPIVDSINNVKNNPDANQFWSIYVWDVNAKDWKFLLEPIDKRILQEGEIIEWRYQKF